MLKTIAAAWYWFIDGLTDSVLACSALTNKRQSVELILGSEPTLLRKASGRFYQPRRTLSSQPSISAAFGIPCCSMDPDPET
jgi:hypothetical protein